MSTDRLAVARVLEQIGEYLELKGENPFRVRAFRGAAKALMELPGAVEDALADGSLAATRGIGPATLTIVKEVVETGRSRYLEELRQEVPSGLLEMLAIPGLGVTRVRLLHEQLKIESLAGLEAAARDGTLAKLRGLGPKTAAKILKGIEFARGTRQFRLFHHAAQEGEVLRSALAALPGTRQVVLAGELRRRCETVGEVVAVVEAQDLPPAQILEAILRLPGMTGTTDYPGRAATLRTPGGGRARVVVTTAADLGAVLVRATGNESHLGQLEARAHAAGFSFEESGLFRDGEPIGTPDEATLYRWLGLQEIPPELREGLDEIERAVNRSLPVLVTQSDVAGFLHCHSTYSDGTTGIEELALACGAAGYEYLGLTDHSQAAAYAGGLTRDDLRRQGGEIDQLNARLSGIRVLKGIEADILGDGQLDYDAATLDRLDFVIGSIHSRFSMGEEEMTARVLRALENPSLTIVGHPTGRLLLSRGPYALDLEAVFARAAERGVALEINGDPHRLDLDWRLVRRAREHGVMISVGADAHGVAGIPNMDYAVGMARKAGLTAAEVLNTRPAEKFLAFARGRGL